MREARIAFCRDRLLAEISSQAIDGLYLPIDLDLDIAGSLGAAAFREACHYVASGMATGIFPSSFPYYYDIHALRARDWCPGSCWNEIQNVKARSSIWGLFVYIRYVSSRQKSLAYLQAQGPISIDSAFGGVGIYSLMQVLNAGARYTTPEVELSQLYLCEHVIFNEFLDHLFINPAWVIAAPPEHIEFRLLPAYGKAWRITRAGLSDVKFLSFSIARCFKNLILQDAHSRRKSNVTIGDSP